MGFWSIKKDPKKQRRREMLRKSAQTWLPKFGELMREYRKLPRRDRKRYNEICEELGLFMKLGSPSYYEHMDWMSIQKDSPEHDKLKYAVRRERELVKEYLARHPEVPDNIRSLILRMNALGDSILESVVVD